ncbi:MAG TPA: hypothetical protein VHX86_16185 [Tepidisphaeraceae bacterium]|jgi:hypothetical protein|nr:hypothetical protein [Tepidisphaeraceae bacterium]
MNYDTQPHRAKTAAAAAGAGAMTQDDLEKMIQTRIGAVTAQSARAVYIGTKMMDLPKAYSDQMPVTDDAAKLEEAEQIIREQYRRDMRIHAPAHALAMGFTQPPQTAQPAVDLSKLTGSELIAEGLRRSKPRIR